MVTNHRAELVVDAGATLGECPRWDDRQHRLLWVDIEGAAVHRFDPATGNDERHPVGDRVGAIALTGDGCVALLPGRLATWEPGEVSSILLDFEPGQPERRCNDAACDPAGRLLVGTMDMSTTGRGRLYQITASRAGAEAELVMDGIGLPNGIEWSPDGRTLYFTDSLTGAVGAFGYDVETGVIGAQTMAIVAPAGLPDGLTVDADGNLWVALWSAGRVACISPSGDVLATVELPVHAVTACAFGGARLDVLYVTSMRHPDADGRIERHAGALFACSVGVTGRSPSRFAPGREGDGFRSGGE